MSSEERWVRIFPRETGIDGHNAVVRRIYGLDGRSFPRLSIAVYGLQFMIDREPYDALRMVRKEPRPDSFKIAFMSKKDDDSFPETSTLPFCLVDEMVDILREAESVMVSIEEERKRVEKN